MLFVKLLRKLGKLLRGGAGDREIFLGALLGVLIGMVPGVNLTLILAILLLLLLNANAGIAMLGFALGKVLCLLLAPVTFQIGHTLVHRIGLEGLFRALADTPVVALLDLHVYCLIGGLPLAVVVGLGSGWIMARAIRGLRVGIMEATQRSERMQKLAQNKLVRLILWLAFGPKKEALAGMLDKKPRLFRKAGVVLALAVLAIVLVLEFLLLDFAVKAGLEHGLAMANGAEVNVGGADLSLLDGKLQLRDVQVTDPEKPTHNLVQIERLSADLSVADLLAKRLTIDLLEASDVRRDAQRSSPGRVFDKPKKEKEEEAKEPEDALTGYFDKVGTLKEYLNKLKDYLDKSKAGQEEGKKPEQEKKDKEKLLELAGNSGYLALSAQDLLAKHPTWTIRKLVVDKIVLGEGGQAQKLEGSELSSHPELNPAPMAIRMEPSAGGAPTLALNFRFDKPGELHTLALNLRDLALGKAMKLSDKAPVDVTDGQADVKAAGGFSADALNIPFDVILRNLKAQAQQGRSVLGLDPKTAEEVFKFVENLELKGAIVGSLTAPRLQLDEKQALASLKDTLIKAGKAQLAGRVNEQLGKVTAELGKKAQEALKGKLPAGLPKLPGLKLPGIKLPGLGGKDEKKEGTEGEKQEDKPKPKAKDLLKKLF